MSYRGKSLEDYAHDIDMPTTRTAGIPERLTKGIFTSRMVSTGNAFTRIAPLLPINVSWDREGRVLSVTSIKTLTPTADSAYWNLATVYATLLKQLSDAFSGASFAQLSSSVISTRLPSRYDIRAAIAELTSLLNTHLFGQRWDRNMRVHEQFLCMDDFKMGVPSEVEIGESGHFLLATEPPSLALATVTGIRTRWTHWLALHEAMGLRNMAPFLYDYFLYQGLDSTTTLSNEGIGVLLESLLGRGQQNPTDILSRIQISQYLAYIMLAISVFFSYKSQSPETQYSAQLHLSSIPEAICVLQLQILTLLCKQRLMVELGLGKATDHVCTLCRLLPTVDMLVLSTSLLASLLVKTLHHAHLRLYRNCFLLIKVKLDRYPKWK